MEPLLYGWRLATEGNVKGVVNWGLYQDGFMYTAVMMTFISLALEMYTRKSDLNSF